MDSDGHSPVCMNCGADNWIESTAMLGLIDTDLRAECKVTRCAECGQFYYMTDAQIEAALKELHQ